LHDLVLSSRNAQRTALASLFFDVDAADGLGAVLSVLQPAMQVPQAWHNAALIFPPRHAIYTSGSLLLQTLERIFEQVDGQ